MRILIVEDNESQRELLTRLLGAEGLYALETGGMIWRFWTGCCRKRTA